MAVHALPAGAWPRRHLQPQLLRGDAGRPRTHGIPRRAEAPVGAHGQAHLEGALRGHPQLRAIPRPQRRAGPQVLPARLREGAAEAVPRPARRAAAELEVLGQRRRGAQTLARLHARLRRHDPPHGHRPRALVCRSRRQQVVHAHGGRRRGDRHRSTRWACATRRSAARSGRSWLRPGQRWPSPDACSSARPAGQ